MRIARARKARTLLSRGKERAKRGDIRAITPRDEVEEGKAGGVTGDPTPAVTDFAYLV